MEEMASSADPDQQAVQAAGSCHFGDEAADFKLPIILTMPLKALFQSTF